MQNIIIMMFVFILFVYSPLPSHISNPTEQIFCRFPVIRTILIRTERQRQVYIKPKSCSS